MSKKIDNSNLMQKGRFPMIFPPFLHIGLCLFGQNILFSTSTFLELLGI
jgi:hypothetical protein